MVDVAVTDDHGRELAGVERELFIPLPGDFSLPLVHPAVEQDTGPVRPDRLTSADLGASSRCIDPLTAAAAPQNVRPGSGDRGVVSFMELILASDPGKRQT